MGKIVQPRGKFTQIPIFYVLEGSEGKEMFWVMGENLFWITYVPDQLGSWVHYPKENSYFRALWRCFRNKLDLCTNLLVHVWPHIVLVPPHPWPVFSCQHGASYCSCNCYTNSRYCCSSIVYKYIVVTLHIDTLILPAMILKIVSLQNLSLRAAWASHWLFCQLKEPWETNRRRRQFSK